MHPGCLVPGREAEDGVGDQEVMLGAGLEGARGHCCCTCLSHACPAHLPRSCCHMTLVLKSPRMMSLSEAGTVEMTALRSS